MIGVVVGDDQPPDDRVSVICQHGLPAEQRPGASEAGVDDRPGAVPVDEGVAVHMVERPGERLGDPQQAGRDLGDDRFAGRISHQALSGPVQTAPAAPFPSHG